MSANTGTSSRTGSITIAGQTFSVTQASPASSSNMTVGSSGKYSTIQNAYNTAGSGDIIQVEASTFPENDNFNINMPVSLVGGYNSGFSVISSTSVINGTLTISNGTVTIRNIRIQ